MVKLPGIAFIPQAEGGVFNPWGELTFPWMYLSFLKLSSKFLRRRKKIYFTLFPEQRRVANIELQGLRTRTLEASGQRKKTQSM